MGARTHAGHARRRRMPHARSARARRAAWYCPSAISLSPRAPFIAARLGQRGGHLLAHHHLELRRPQLPVLVAQRALLRRRRVGLRGRPGAAGPGAEPAGPLALLQTSAHHHHIDLFKATPTVEENRAPSAVGDRRPLPHRAVTSTAGPASGPPHQLAGLRTATRPAGLSQGAGNPGRGAWTTPRPSVRPARRRTRACADGRDGQLRRAPGPT